VAALEEAIVSVGKHTYLYGGFEGRGDDYRCSDEGYWKQDYFQG
jgi:hypothetical protein